MGGTSAPAGSQQLDAAGAVGGGGHLASTRGGH